MNGTQAAEADMATRMERQECGAEKVKRQCRHLAEDVRRAVGLGIADEVRVTEDFASVATPYRDAAERAARLFREGGYRNVEVYPCPVRPNVWVASGLV
jgi:spore maturation protein CgeB